MALQVKADEDKQRVLALKADGRHTADKPKQQRAPSAYVVRHEAPCIPAAAVV